MNRIIVISYTEAGAQLNKKISHYLTESGDVAISFCCGADFHSTKDLLSKEWRRTSAFVFVGAVGIAVRHIAPLLEDKLHDPAVLVADEQGGFVIPVLSGHIGGGVALAQNVAHMLGAQAVITTATDVRNCFAVDVFAKDNHLLFPDPTAIKRISAAVLRGEKIEVGTGIPMKGTVPAGVTVYEETSDAESNCANDSRADRYDMMYDVRIRHAGKAEIYRMPLCPYIVGIGCKRGKSGEELLEMLAQICVRYGIGLSRIAALTSIDLKKEEAGIWELSRKLSVPYEVFSAEELEQIAGSVSASAFVKQTVGVDNVCERSALCLARQWSDADIGQETGGEHCTEDVKQIGSYELVVTKQARDGITMAIACFHPTFYYFR